MSGKTLFFLMIGTMLVSSASTRLESKGPASDNTPAALTGTVTSQAEGHMEGVLVRAKPPGGTITVTVVSDSQGRYAFPRDRLQPGKYHLSIRAAGYDLDDPGVVEVSPNKTASVDLKLSKTKDLASQLMSTEWLISVPGTDEQKMELYQCVGCHSAALPLQGKHNADEFMSLFMRMRNHGPAAFLLKPVELPYKVTEASPKDAAYAEYLSSINLSRDGKRSYDLKTLPRPTGKATKVIITEYDLPNRLIEPHDAVVDRDGMVWFSDFGRNYIGRLNPRTGEAKQWPTPILKQGFPEGGLDIKFDKQGNPWMTMLFQGGIAKFDKKTEKISTWSVPEEHNNVHTRVGMISISPKDGTVWFKSSTTLEVYGLDPKADRVFATYAVPPMGVYGMEISSQGNLYLFGLGKSLVGVMDTKTGKTELFPTPTPGGGPRRGDVDSQDRAWFAEYWSGKIGVFDPKTKEMKEWPVPTPWAGSYDLVVDKNKEVWAGGMSTDYVFRLNPATGEVTEYLLPTLDANLRRVDVDNSGDRVAVWVGEVHQAKLAKLEALE